jgi:hypothetical protein
MLPGDHAGERAGTWLKLLIPQDKRVAGAEAGRVPVGLAKVRLAHLREAL